MRIIKFKESINTQEIIKHYFIDQKMEVKDVIRKRGDGRNIRISGVGIITEIRKLGDDIAYAVEFPNIKRKYRAEDPYGEEIWEEDYDEDTLVMKSPYGKEWIPTTITFNIFHNEDKDNIIKVS